MGEDGSLSHFPSLPKREKKKKSLSPSFLFPFFSFHFPSGIFGPCRKAEKEFLPFSPPFFFTYLLSVLSSSPLTERMAEGEGSNSALLFRPPPPLFSVLSFRSKDSERRMNKNLSRKVVFSTFAWQGFPYEIGRPIRTGPIYR